MSRRHARRPARLPAGEFRIRIDRLGHDGRGIGQLDGKTVFVEGALPGEEVAFRYTFRRNNFDEGVATQIVAASAMRIEPACPHAGTCGGCSMQHLAADAQLAMKQRVLLEQLQHFGCVSPQEILPALTGERFGYRRKARLAVHGHGRGSVRVGFREKRSNNIADIDSCAVLLPEVGREIMALRALLSSLVARDRIPQVEVAAGDETVALVIRHLDALSESDHAALVDWCRVRGFHCYLQPGNESTLWRAWPPRAAAPADRDDAGLVYRLDDFGMELCFHPGDFTQVNSSVNRLMVRHAIELLDPQPADRVLDLFCGLGNFTLPLATRAAHVTGVEGSMAMVERATGNVAHNRSRGVDLGETRFFAANLDGDFAGASWARERYDRLLIDPPRSGAEALCRVASRFGAVRIVYVSCNPATFARDAGLLAAQGYVLEKVGVMDMFPHTAHVESIALFGKSAGNRR